MTQISKYIFILLVSIPLFAGCADDEGDSRDKFWVEVVSVIPTDDGGCYIKLDNGRILYPQSFVTGVPEAYTRAQVDYTILPDSVEGYDHSVRVNYLRTILTKNILQGSSEIVEDDLGNDKVKILELWEGDDFLNIHFGVNIGGSGTLHSINMIDNGEDKDGYINLEFRHNANGDTPRYGVKSLVAFDLRPYQKRNAETVKFKIKLNAFSGSDSEYIFTYNYTGTKNNTSFHSEAEVRTDDWRIN